MTDLDPATLKGWRILIVEDETDNAELVRRIFRHFGAEAVVVHDGRDALDQLADGEFSLVLCDLSLPTIDGWALIQKIREDHAATLPVIALTAHAMYGDRERALGAGFSGYYTKPIDDTYQLLNYVLDIVAGIEPL